MILDLINMLRGTMLDFKLALHGLEFYNID